MARRNPSKKRHAEAAKDAYGLARQHLDSAQAATLAMYRIENAIGAVYWGAIATQEADFDYADEPGRFLKAKEIVEEARSIIHSACKVRLPARPRKAPRRKKENPGSKSILRKAMRGT